jgi:chemotaxis protein methyltransferase CheR
MNRAVFDYFADLLRQESGLQMTPEKYYLLETRLHHIVQQQGVKGIGGLSSLLRRDIENKALRQAVIEAMATHETSFFRDMAPFERFRDTVLPKMAQLRAGARSLRIWSAACASGQEAYSIAMVMRECAGLFSGWEIEITATDLSHEMVARAQKGGYSQFEVQRGVPARLLVKYFTQEGDVWRINEDVRSMISFRQANLMRPLPLAPGSQDIVFCRNVLMYLDAAARTAVLQALHRVMHAESVLLLGAAESVEVKSGLFDPVAGMPGFYVRADAAADLGPVRT